LLPVKVVMADDEHGVMLILCSILSKLEGALVIGTADNAKDAIALVREHNPDLAFLDIELPDMKGIELAEKLRDICFLQALFPCVCKLPLQQPRQGIYA
jgi:YesN/AraC family two-component response regulator